MNIEFGLASHADDQALRALLGANPVPGAMTMTFTREPSFFESIAVMGKKNAVFIGRKEHQKEILAMGMASYIDSYVNGKPREIGFLSGLRIDQQLRRSRCLFQGYDYLKQWDAERGLPFYLSTIIEDNHAARKILSFNRMSIPKYTDIGRYITYAVLLRKARKQENSGYAIKRVSQLDELDAALDLINSEGARKQYYPVYTKKDLLSFKGFDYRNLWVCRDNNEILGVVGVWDQMSFKQTRVSAYDFQWNLVKPFYNLLSYPMGYKKLPKCGEKFEYFFLSFVAVKDNRPGIFLAILNRIYNEYADGKYHYMVIGLHEQDPLTRAVEAFRTIRYNARMYVVSYKKVDMQELQRTPIPYLESARL